MSGPAAGNAGRSSVERLLEKNLIDDSGLGKPLSRRAATTQRSVEAYLKGGVKPRWMERGRGREREPAGGPPAGRRPGERPSHPVPGEGGRARPAFARRWRDLVRAW